MSNPHLSYRLIVGGKHPATKPCYVRGQRCHKTARPSGPRYGTVQLPYAYNWSPILRKNIIMPRSTRPSSYNSLGSRSRHADEFENHQWLQLTCMPLIHPSFGPALSNGAPIVQPPPSLTLRYRHVVAQRNDVAATIRDSVLGLSKGVNNHLGPRGKQSRSTHSQNTQTN